MTPEKMIEAAIGAREKAYVPYSRFPVGAAVMMTSGRLYTGTNIENAAYPVSCCAERVAIFNAIASGEYGFRAMAVVADTDRPVPPCGSCRQVMNEFFTRDTSIYLANLNGESETLHIESLLPYSFRPDDFHRSV